MNAESIATNTFSDPDLALAVTAYASTGCLG
jgi:hypothetical protein